MVFIGREAELGWLREYAGADRSTPYVVYGPEGCGKTALALEAVRRFSYWYPRGVALYLDGKARRGEDVFKSNIQLGDVLADVAGELLGRIGGAAARAAVWLLGRVVERLVERMSPSNILVIVDELFSAVGVREGAVVVKHAQELGDRHLRSLKAEAGLIPRPLAGVRIAYLVFTSEGASRRELSRHSWAHTALMWNMDKDDFRRLNEAVGGPDFAAAWRLCGGNPRCLFQLAEAGWDAEKYLASISSSRGVRWVVAKAAELGLTDALKEAVENPDILAEPSGLRLAKLLESRNFVVELSPAAIGGVPSRDPELGVGRLYAWQTPALRDAVARALRG